MKIKLDIDATPQELRTFFGLPDVTPLQNEIMENLREKMIAGTEGYDPLTLLRPFLPESLQSLESVQKMFWDAFRQNLTPTDANKSSE